MMRLRENLPMVVMTAVTAATLIGIKKEVASLTTNLALAAVT
jgi:hypothetical protein